MKNIKEKDKNVNSATAGDYSAIEVKDYVFPEGGIYNRL